MRREQLRHDLKTPLAVISGYAELLAVRDDERTRVEASKRILEAARQLERAIDELVDGTPTPAGPPDAVRHRVLVVDDDRLLRDLVTATLGADEYDVTVAWDRASVSEGLDAEQSVVVLDWRLPDTSGAEVLAAIKERTPDLPVVVLTADAQVEQRNQARALGADAFLTKPFSPLELLATVERLLG